MEREVEIWAIYRHFTWNQYKVIAVAEHTETWEILVIYQALYWEWKIFARPCDMFMSKVDHYKYPEIKQKYRFEKINDF